MLLLLCSEKLHGVALAGYFDLVQEAELLICNERITEALRHYDKAFTLKRDAFGRDVYHAWVCAYLNDDEKRFRTYSVHLLKKGAYETQTMYMILNQVKGGPGVEKYQSIWQQLRRAVKSDVDTVFLNRLNELSEANLAARLHFIAACGDNYPACARDSLNKLDSLSVLKLQLLFETEGFATENKVGFAGGMPADPPAFNNLLRDDRYWTNRTTIDSFLYTRVLTGQYHPQDYASLKDFSYNLVRDSISLYQRNPDARYCSDLFTVINNALYITDPALLSVRANAARKDIYLESLEDRCVKAKFQFLHPYFQFLNAAYLANWDNAPDDLVNRMPGSMLTGAQVDALNTIRDRKCPHGLQH